MTEIPWSWTYDVVDNSVPEENSAETITNDRVITHQVPYKDPDTNKEWVFIFNGGKKEDLQNNKEVAEISILN